VSAHAALRAATAADHERVDRLFSRLDLGSELDYRLFLTAQAAAHLPIEQALETAAVSALIPDWPDRRRSELLLADLAELGVEPPPAVPPPPLEGASAVLGAAYVLEGSRLGGAYLKRSLTPQAPRRFLAAAQAAGAWRKLLAKLDESLYEPAQVEEACETARQVFMRFEISGRRYLELAKS
jgi:heme oxygenase